MVCCSANLRVSLFLATKKNGLNIINGECPVQVGRWVAVQIVEKHLEFFQHRVCVDVTCVNQKAAVGTVRQGELLLLMKVRTPATPPLQSCVCRVYCFRVGLRSAACGGSGIPGICSHAIFQSFLSQKLHTLGFWLHRM